ncbi:hypothetical protein LR48_Vigan02g261700 [Vigna angularis]|uniref:Uncharacterized protein n=1 Tax=Phaseolus angularis TaxID=3914 RepID=A0A0L9U1D4_PHAAN|nr:hypothetical protein LR48_Vigan02g261700 [Vigna angularis]
MVELKICKNSLRWLTILLPLSTSTPTPPPLPRSFTSAPPPSTALRSGRIAECSKVLGFSPIRRPGSFDFDGAWLFGYGIGIHLLEAENPEKLPKKKEINPKDNHISFQNKRNMYKHKDQTKDRRNNDTLLHSAILPDRRAVEGGGAEVKDRGRGGGVGVEVERGRRIVSHLRLFLQIFNSTMTERGIPLATLRWLTILLPLSTSTPTPPPLPRSFTSAPPPSTALRSGRIAECSKVLGFSPIRRPGSFDFDGAWLFGYGIGIHLLEAENPEKLPKKKEINPKDNHISFQNKRNMYKHKDQTKDRRNNDTLLHSAILPDRRAVEGGGAEVKDRGRGGGVRVEVERGRRIVSHLKLFLQIFNSTMTERGIPLAT